ncbi:hypothetical protein C3733_20115 [Bacillus amyloliquefaciens]|nr:hypothetical protein C3733_20115 [Bacillus amyloliquefaciens]
MLNWDMLKPPGQPLADHGWGRLARQKQKKELNRAGHKPAFHLRGCDQDFGSISACFDFEVFVIADSLRKVEEHSGVVLRLAKRD